MNVSRANEPASAASASAWRPCGRVLGAIVLGVFVAVGALGSVRPAEAEASGAGAPAGGAIQATGVHHVGADRDARPDASPDAGLDAELDAELRARINAAIAAARQALAEDNPDHAAELLRAVLASDRTHREAAALLLVALDEQSGPERDDDAVAQTLAELERIVGGSFIRLESKRFVVLSNADADWTRQRMQLLERTHHQFERVMRRLGLDAEPPRRKLLCVLIREHADYRAFAGMADRVDAPWVAGYYAALTNRVVMYDDATGPSFAALSRRAHDIHAEAKRTEEQARLARRERQRDAADQLLARAERLHEHADAERRRLAELAAEAADAKAVHEAVHLIAFNTGVQSRARQYPIWLTEGLATSFETERPGQAFGPDHAYEPREREFRETFDADRLLPLRELVRLNDSSSVSPDAAGPLYAQSYALFRYLFRFERAALAGLFRDIDDEPAGRISGERHAALFAARFGDVAALEARWLAWEAQQR